MDAKTDGSIMSTPGEVLEGLLAECSGYRTPPRSALSVTVVPAAAASAGDVVFTHSDSLCELFHSAETDVLTSNGSDGDR